MSSAFGRRFVVSTFGESHGPAIGAVIDGCPAGMALSESDIQPQLDRRRPGHSAIASERNKADRVRILSGVDNGVTLGSPIALTVANLDPRPAEYETALTAPRPSHADYTYLLKYGVAARSGGGRASARETVGRVAAGAVAEKFLRERHGVRCVAWVSAVGDLVAPDLTGTSVQREDVDRSAARCPDPAAAAAMVSLIERVRGEQDSIGAVVTCVCRDVPPGLGEPVFGKLPAVLAAAMLSIPAARAFEVGAGFAAARLRGSVHNDPFVKKGERLGTVTNRGGGVQGGISNGEDIVFRVAFKPPATIGRPQATVDFDGRPVSLQCRGRHDPCVGPRAVPVVEAMAALVLADAALLAV